MFSNIISSGLKKVFVPQYPKDILHKVEMDKFDIFKLFNEFELFYPTWPKGDKVANLSSFLIPLNLHQL